MKCFVLAGILENTDVQHSFRIVLHWHNKLSSAKLIACGLDQCILMQYNWICGQAQSVNVRTSKHIIANIYVL